MGKKQQDADLVPCQNCKSVQLKVMKNNLTMTASVECPCGNKAGDVPFKFDIAKNIDTSNDACAKARIIWNQKAVQGGADKFAEPPRRNVATSAVVEDGGDW